MTHGLTDALFYEKVSSFLVWFYVVLAAMNGIAALYVWRTGQTKKWIGLPGGHGLGITNAVVWLLVAAAFAVCAALAGSGMSGNGAWMPSMPEAWKNFIDSNTGPVVYSLGTTVLLAALFVFRRFFTTPAVAWTILNLMLLFLGLSMTDRDFFEIVAKPDNVPIVMLILLLAFFTWLATYRAVINDDRMERGEPPLEKLDDEKVLVWPDLVYIELICMIALTAFLIFWAIALPAPLEEPANIAKTPNPSKAPWYFLGLQEMLVYFDPWMAGVVLPLLVVNGLMAIPYLDFNKQGNGYYTIKQRKFAYLTFQFGFLEIWITLIVLGTLLRGPNWNFFGPYEYWDAHKVEAADNINLSQIWWEKLLGSSLPMPPSGAGFLVQAGHILLREWLGFALTLGYFIVLPPVLALTVLKRYYQKMGLIRFMLMANLLLFMAALPIKMVLRWVFTLKYIIWIPEWFLNF
ncbi:MAG: hypothetical protein CMJ58_08005 [Planctomycetaceae bacterium]|nr:hypothetical protein [Planctomycetaceae bacterium]